MTVSVLGAVQAPGRATVEQQTRLSGVITLGGGFVGMADKKNIKVIRGNDTLTVNYNEYESEGKGEVNLMLEGGDVIFVPYIKSDATISVETVAANVTVPYVEGRTLGEYLDKTPGAMDLKAKWVKIKKPSGTVDVYELTKARDLRLEPQSHIELWNKDPYIYVGGAVAAVGKALYTPGLHAIDYIGASGVTIITGSFRRVSRIRNGKCESIDPYNGEIQPGDYIEIPRSIYESVKDVTLFLASLLSVVATAIIISTY
jgi:protein involved in polysaccharide export with SLBB domain